MTTPQQIIDEEVKELENLAHAYFEPGDKGYWDGIELGKDFLRSSSHRIFTQAIEMAIELLNKQGDFMVEDPFGNMKQGVFKEDFTAELKELKDNIKYYERSNK